MSNYTKFGLKIVNVVNATLNKTFNAGWSVVDFFSRILFKVTSKLLLSSALLLLLLILVSIPSVLRFGGHSNKILNGPQYAFLISDANAKAHEVKSNENRPENVNANPDENSNANGSTPDNNGSYASSNSNASTDTDKSVDGQSKKFSSTPFNYYAAEKSIPMELQYPSNLLMLSSDSHHVLIVEKATHRLHLFQNKKSYAEYVHSYQIATGQTSGDKSNRGDFKTPEGIYQLVSFLSHEQLLKQYGNNGKIYGVGAFVLNYPNVFDGREGKTGGGIWLHSTNDESRLSKGLDSKGCVVLANESLKDISRYIELGKTPIIIVQDLFFLRKETWDNNREAIYKNLQGWLNAWKEKNINSYISYYHPEFRDSVKGNIKGFKNYKSSVFKNSGKPTIRISNVSILTFEKYAVVQFEQYYKSKTIDDTGLKFLYLKKDDNYKWKIYAEIFKKSDRPISLTSAFTPSMRFFKETKSSKN